MNNAPEKIKESKGIKGMGSTAQEVPQGSCDAAALPNTCSMLAHDLRSGLALILGYSELLPQMEGEQTKQVYDGMQKCSRRLVRMLDNLLVSEELGANGRGLRLESVDAVEEVMKVASEFAAKAKAQDVSLSVHVGSRLQNAIFDRDLLERAAANLVDNAINHSPPGAAISVGIEDCMRAGRKYLAVTVSDEGPGIPLEEQAHVFDKYYRSSSASRMKGSGLGLAIVKAVAEAHGGFVELESNVGKGSKFIVFLLLD